MRVSRRAWSRLMAVMLVAGFSPVSAQVGAGAGVTLPPGGFGSLTQNDLALRIRTPDVEVRFIPLDARVTRLLAKDSWESLRSVVESKRAAIDSVANASGVSRPGLALVTFFGQRVNARFDPQTLTVSARSREFRPLGIVPFSGRFTSQQLNVREQVSAIYLFEEDLPVNDSFIVLYAGQASDDWQGKQRSLDRERARVASRERGSVRDTTSAGGAGAVTSSGAAGPTTADTAATATGGAPGDSGTGADSTAADSAR
ncbi:MAG TPA: hypothetical protein VFN08_05625 [Gemmatimonadales bacterium]|nr:hypothetical protein [Gemmatimonadales bacterium]